MEKRKSAYMRFGRSSPFDGGVDEMASGDMEKRKSAYMRLVIYLSSSSQKSNLNFNFKLNFVYLQIWKTFIFR